MGLFSPNNNGSGSHGVLSRGGKLITRYSLRILGAGGLATLSALPYLLGIVFSVLSHGLLVVLIAGPIGGILAAPQLCGLSDTLHRALRDEDEAWWPTYCRAWRQNLKCSLLPGGLLGLLFAFQIFIIAHANAMGLDLLLFIVLVIGLSVTISVIAWLLPQLVLMELPFHRALLNAVFLALWHPLRSIIIDLLVLFYLVFSVFTFPYFTLLVILFNLWLPVLIITMITYNTIDETFHIEEALESMQDEAPLSSDAASE